MKKIFSTLAALIAATALALTFAACVDVTEVTLNETELTLEVGEKKTLEATVSPQNATDKTVSWTSSDPAVAMVTDGKVKAVKKGSATVTAKAGEKTATCNITVTDPTPTAMTKAEWNEAIDNTLHAGNVTLIQGILDKEEILAEVRIAEKTKSIRFNNADNSYIIITEEGDNFQYTCSDESLECVVPVCEGYLNKPIKTFADLSYAYICEFTHINLFKDLEFTFNAAENSYFIQVTLNEQKTPVKFYFETVDGKTRITKYITDPDSEYSGEWIFINYGTTKTNIPSN